MALRKAARPCTHKTGQWSNEDLNSDKCSSDNDNNDSMSLHVNAVTDCDRHEHSSPRLAEKPDPVESL